MTPQLESLELSIRGLFEREGVIAARSAELGASFFDASQARLRIASGQASAKHFTFRNPERAALAQKTFPWAQGYITLAVPFRTSGGGDSAVAGYASQRTYDRLREVLTATVGLVRGSGMRAVSLFDSNQAFDKGLARRAGVGLVGRHSMIMVPGFGARVVLGSVFTEELLDISVGTKFATNPCRNCDRCIRACPTEAILAPGRVIAERCIANIVQQEQWSRDDRRIVGTHVYGCDVCIDACPIGWRQTQPETPLPLVRWLNSDDETLLAELGHWYLPRRDPFYARRNVANAFANSLMPTREERLALYRLCLRPVSRERAEGIRAVLTLRWRT